MADRKEKLNVPNGIKKENGTISKEEMGLLKNGKNKDRTVRFCSFLFEKCSSSELTGVSSVWCKQGVKLFEKNEEIGFSDSSRCTTVTTSPRQTGAGAGSCASRRSGQTEPFLGFSTLLEFCTWKCSRSTTTELTLQIWHSKYVSFFFFVYNFKC